MASISNLGYGPISITALENLIASGEVEVRMEGGKLITAAALIRYK